MCALMCVCALMHKRLLSYVCSLYVCRHICVHMNVFVLICVLSQVCSLMCALTCALICVHAHLLAHTRALICVLSCILFTLVFFYSTLFGVFCRDNLLFKVTLKISGVQFVTPAQNGFGLRF